MGVLGARAGFCHGVRGNIFGGCRRGKGGRNFERAVEFLHKPCLLLVGACMAGPQRCGGIFWGLLIRQGRAEPSPAPYGGIMK